MCKVTQLARGRGRVLFICGLLLLGGAKPRLNLNLRLSCFGLPSDVMAGTYHQTRLSEPGFELKTC